MGLRSVFLQLLKLTLIAFLNFMQMVLWSIFIGKINVFMIL